MKRLLGIAIGSFFFMTAAGAYASEPGDCFNGGDSPGCSPAFCPGDPLNLECSADDSGCVSNSSSCPGLPCAAAKGHLKCSSAIGHAFCNLVKCVIGCHKKQADARFKGMTQDLADAAEDTCEIGPAGGKSCKEKLDAALAKVIAKGGCDSAQISNAASEEVVLIGHPSPIPSLSLDYQNGGVYCDSTGGAVFIEDMDCEGGTNNGADCTTNADCTGGGKCLREDTGWVPKDKFNLACEDALGKAVGAVTCCTIKCHATMNGKFFAGKPFNEEACEETNLKKNACLDKFNKVRDKTLGKGICPACNDLFGWDSQSANAVGTVDGANVIVYPCGLN
jgi:hypothetical protein